jgi:hypothetical protein
LIQDYQELLGAIMVLESPLSADSLFQLLGVAERQTERKLSSLCSVLNIPEDPAKPVRLFYLLF